MIEWRVVYINVREECEFYEKTSDDNYTCSCAWHYADTLYKCRRNCRIRNARHI